MQKHFGNAESLIQMDELLIRKSIVKITALFQMAEGIDRSNCYMKYENYIIQEISWKMTSATLNVLIHNSVNIFSIKN